MKFLQYLNDTTTGGFNTPSGKAPEVIKTLAEEASNWIYYFLTISIPVVAIIFISAIVIFSTLMSTSTDQEKRSFYKKSLKIVLISLVIVIVAIASIPIVLAKIGGLI
ncbi:Mbov_0395 family pilin-like conjugal transfer protein [Mesomycoplasma neurolyticum]|uniref:Uncharacterized protein n=1 Tax=Mesomycoplasma neurolyticum TaxID=2120 RepID=A0A449A5H5_9BACT|nr:hypothetical protein [Mesomycoplasma neurolyticum]VEU59477.1 Uncharacterised protein [Mesomycoplasma neurolyticum]VEU59882.1 Uncharacterised protein [Mesomycoplasma neurolyticum]